MRTAVVVEVHCNGHCCDDLADAGEGLAEQQLVLHGAVDAFGLGVVLRVARLGHAYPYPAGLEQRYILAAGVLASAVGVVYQADFLAFDASQGHLQGFHRIGRVECRADAPSDYLLGIRVKHHRQVAEVVMAFVIHNHDVGYVADPKLVGSRRDEVLHEVGIGRESMRGVRRAGLPDPQTDLEAVLVDDTAEAVASDGKVTSELGLVHVPQLLPADAGIGLPYLPDVLQGKLLPGGLGQCRVFIILVIGLLAHAKQPAE